MSVQEVGTVVPTAEVLKIPVPLCGVTSVCPFQHNSFLNDLHFSSWKHNITQREARALVLAGQSQGKEDKEAQER